MTNRNVNLSKHELPVASPLADELVQLWESTFGDSYADFRPVLEGSEQPVNCNRLYLVNENDRVVATTQLTTNRTDPTIGGLGEVVTLDSHRRKGLARELRSQARDEFLANGGEACFLGTVNPGAARLYHDLGWRRLASTTLMCLVSGDRSPEEFLIDYFRDINDVQIEVGSAAHRIGMIPLLVCPHDGPVLDANTNLYSTRYAVQSSCMGLYPRYHRLTVESNGQWFGATSNGRAVGLASVKLNDGAASLDGFVHRNAN
ncbi:MAG: hypothetical protein CMJ78_18465, partial [Planctomycetaceae bacterium]|nr:hypothetical protein [Planctomycetaceae bacterium]